jgi:hypothetical protein
VKAWRQLLELDGEQIGSVDAGLIARFELALLDQADRAAFYHDLAGGRWKLDKPHYLFYFEVAREWVPSTDAWRAMERDKLAFAEAVEQFESVRRHIIGDYVAF